MNAIHTLGWALVHSLWQDALAAAGLASLLTLVPARAARARYALAALTLAIMLALPLATALRLDAASDAAMPALAAPALTSLVDLLQTVVGRLLFYHPAVWWVSTRVREEREHCCDDLAVAACGDARVYATALLRMEQLRAAPALVLGAGGGSLLGRVRRLLAPATPDASPRGLAGVVGGALALVVAIGSSWGLHRSLPASADSPIALATGSHDPEVRHDAVKELGQTKDPRARMT